MSLQDLDIEDLLEAHSQYSANMASTYHISTHSASSYQSLVDRGANAGLGAADVHVPETTGRNVSVLDDHEIPGLDIVTCVALIETNHGSVNMLMHEYVYYARGKTIDSPCQIEWFNNTCDDKSDHVGGKQVITFPDGYATPLECRSCLMYMSIHGKPTDNIAIHILSILSDTPNTSIQKHDQQLTAIDYNKLNPYFGG